MRINCKLFITSVIVCCAVTSVFAKKADTLSTKHDDNVKTSLQQQNMFNKVKTNITNSVPVSQKSDIEGINNSMIVDQLYNRLVEKTENNHITEIAGQSIDDIKGEIKKLEDSQLKQENLKNFSLGLLKFIATGCNSYGPNAYKDRPNAYKDCITPDMALEQYNSMVDEKSQLKKEEVQKDRENDAQEIANRETFQDLEKEINEIIQRNNYGITNQGQSEEIQYLQTIFSENNALNEALINILSENDNNDSPELTPPSSTEIQELREAVEKLELPGVEKNSIKDKLKKYKNILKNLFKLKKDAKKNNNGANNNIEEAKPRFNPINQKQVKIRTTDNNTRSNTSLTKEEAVELMLENSAVLSSY